jgi:flagellar motor switch/type III secretory pathway protein FliN
MSASEQSNMSVREYKLVNRSESALLASRVRQVLQMFAARLAMPVPDVQCSLCALAATDAAKLRHYEWSMAQRGEERLLGIGLDAESSTRELARLMLGDAQAVALDVEGLGAVREIGMAMMQEFGSALIAALDAPRTADTRLHWERGAAPSFGGTGEATMIAECTVGERLRLALMLWPTTVLSCLARAEAPRSDGPLEPLRGAIESGTVRLEVLAGEAEMAVGELATLRLGDVIKLNHKLERPLAVRIHEGEAIGTGYLGTRHGRTAVRWATGH